MSPLRSIQKQPHILTSNKKASNSAVWLPWYIFLKGIAWVILKKEVPFPFESFSEIKLNVSKLQSTTLRYSFIFLMQHKITIDLPLADMFSYQWSCNQLKTNRKQYPRWQIDKFIKKTN